MAEIRMMNKRKTVIFLFISILSINLLAKSADAEWFQKVFKLIERIGAEDDRESIRLDIIKYHQILFALGDTEKAFRWFNKPGFDEEKDIFLQYVFKTNYLKRNVDSKMLTQIHNAIMNLRVPYGVSKYLIKTAELYREVGETEKIKPVLEEAVRKSLDQELGYVDKAIDLSKIYKIFRLMGEEEEAKKIYAKMLTYYPICKEFKYRGFNASLIFLPYADVFWELGDKELAKRFIDKAHQAIVKSKYRRYFKGVLLRVADYYLKTGQREKAFKIVDEALASCFALERKSAENCINCLSELFQKLFYSDVMEHYGVRSIIDKLIQKKKSVKNSSLIKEIDWILFRLYRSVKDFKKEWEYAKGFKQTDAEDDTRSEYFYLIASQQLEHGEHVNMDSIINQITSTHYRIELYFYAGKYYSKQNRPAEAVEMFNRAASLLAGYNPKDVVFTGGADFYYLVKEYWKLNDWNGLKRIRKHLLEKKEDDGLHGVLFNAAVSLIDVYLNKGMLKAAQETLSEIQYPTTKAVGMLHMAKFFMDAGNENKAREYFDNSYRILERSEGTDVADIEVVLNAYFKLFIKDEVPIEYEE